MNVFGTPGDIARRSGRRPGSRRRVAGLLALVLAVTLLGEAPAQAARWQPPVPPQPTGVPVKAAQPIPAAQPGQPDAVQGQAAVMWPAAGKTTVDLRQAVSPSQGAQAASGTGMARAGGFPIHIGQSFGDASDPVAGASDVLTSVRRAAAVAKATVTVHDRAAAARAGVEGLLFAVDRADGHTRPGRVNVRVDYDQFADAYGGDWVSRLRLVTLPACALSTPEVAGCVTATPLATRNDVNTSSLSAAVPVGGGEATVLAVQAGPDGDNGSFTATSLSQAGAWNVGVQTGDFTYSYPLQAAPSHGGPAPTLSLGYSSGSIDGRTSTSNNQGEWIGDGWQMWPGFIERKYASCVDDNPDRKTGDLCWKSSNATLSLSGHAGELIETGTANVWRLKNDDGTRVERLTDAARANGDNDNEYWKVTTTDGTQYFFGYHRLPGWVDGKTATYSTWTAPVYGNNTGEPCYNSTFANAWCKQAWRWNLDYVVDPRGNTMAYFYGRETGWYGRNLDANLRTDYIRGGYLARIEYGMRQNAEYASAAPMRVVFATAERCLSACWTGTAWASAPNTAAWPDTPYDQDCAAAPCTDKLSPTFWSQRRLSKVTTQVRSSATTYRNVDSWTLRHEFLDAGDNEGKPMWLRGITRTGHVTTAGGSTASVPEIIFSPGAEPLPNRVDGPSDGRTSLTRFRLKTVTTESGGNINIGYSGPDCTKDSLPNPHSNTKRCMPSFYAPVGTPTLDWFHKYVVTGVSLQDVQYTAGDGSIVANNPAQHTFYDYLDTPAWHYTDDEITPDKWKTWADWRGYGRVRVRTGSETGPQTAVEHRFLRGMDGDKQPSGLRDVWVADSWGGSTEDHEALNGFTLQTITFNGPGGAEVASTLNTPWRHGPTATRTRNGVTVNAWITNTATSRNRTAIGAGFRTSKTSTAFNNDGFPLTLDSFGDEAITGDETCTRYLYARNDTTWMIDKVAQVETLSGSCAAAANPPTPSTVLARSRTFYDTYVNDSSFGAAPGRGEVVRTEELDAFSGDTPVYSRTFNGTYDEYGRPQDSFDAMGNKTVTAYTTDANTGLVTAVTVTNPLSHQEISTLEPARQQPVKVTDPNGIATEATYDGLGRTTQVWQPGRSKATESPSVKYSYLLRSTGGPTVITTEALGPDGESYIKQATLFDGFLRTRQTQTQAPNGGGRTITETLHHPFGDIAWTSASYYDSTDTDVATSLGYPSGQIPSITQQTYDNAGRPTATVFKAWGVEKWRITNGYTGDRINTTPPVGGTATTAIYDVFGRMTELRQYKNRADVGSNDTTKFDKTGYQYSLLGQPNKATDPAGNQWTNTYDLRGRKKQSTDPDSGTTTITFNNAGQPITVTAPLGSGTATTAYTYDSLGRQKTLRDDTITGTKRIEWVYDTLPNGKGKLTSATRYVAGHAYVSKVDAYDTAGRVTSASTVLPSAAEADLCAGGTTPNTCTYTNTYIYRANGQVDTVGLPKAADLAAESLWLGYTDTGLPSSLQSSLQRYAGGVTYDKLSQLISRQLGNTGKRVAQAYTIDEPTRRLTAMNVVPEAKPAAADYRYTYDNAGNVTKISDIPAGQTGDHQCYQYDYQRRLTEAWTPSNGDCAATKTVSGLGGPAPYWRSWTFDAIGNRKTETVHAATNTTFTYTYPTPGAGVARPHAVSYVTASGGQTWTRNYAYDNAGNTKTRPKNNGSTQTLTYDREGKLTTLLDGTNTTNNIYAADGSRLIRKDPDGSKTLYLPDGTEVRNVGTVKTAKRYYHHAGTLIATRTAAGVTWITTDHHGTTELAINRDTLAVAKRRTLPYGAQRGTTTGTWPTGLDKGFVGGTQDPTELTHIGAREYDPTTGRFLSVDPLMNLADPQQWNGYAYANNNPVTLSDPDGLLPWDGIVDAIKGAVEKLTRPVKDSNKDGKTTTGDVAHNTCNPGVGRAYCQHAREIGDAVGMVTPSDDWLGCAIDHSASSCAILGVGAAMPAAGALVAGLFRYLKTLGKAISKATRANRTATKVDNVPTGRPVPVKCGNSFSPDTPVLLADGTAKPIKDVEVGDLVTAGDPERKEITKQTVTKVHVNRDEELTDVMVVAATPAREQDDLQQPKYGPAVPEAKAVIQTTQHHRFWDAAAAKWTYASELVPGHSTLIDPAGQVQHVVQVHNFAGSRYMYDLTVANVHTYYVLAGDTPVLVHNCGGANPGHPDSCSCGYGPTGDPIYPPNGGFNGPSYTRTMRPGEQMDRYGYPGGSYTSPVGTPFGARALPADAINRPYTAYEVVKPFDVQAGEVRPWFGQPGLGVQYRLSTSVQQLINDGFLRAVS